MPSPRPHIFLLPDELLLQIYSYLPWPDLIFLRRAHPHFDHIFTTQSLLPPVSTVLEPQSISKFRTNNPFRIDPRLNSLWYLNETDDNDDEDEMNDDDNNDLGDGTLPSLSSVFTLAEMGGSKDMLIQSARELKRSGTYT